jgi:hypothetical protein
MRAAVQHLLKLLFESKNLFLTIGTKKGFYHTKYTSCQAFCLVVGIGSPHPLTRKGVLLPPPMGPRGRHTTVRGKGRGPNFDEGTYTLVLYVYYNPSTSFILDTEMHVRGGGGLFQRFSFSLIRKNR